MPQNKNEYSVTWKATDDLLPYARNSRTHSDSQVAQIAASIREFGWTNPILVDQEGTIIAGHGRVMAARKLGEQRVPVITLAHLTDAQKRAYVIADNQLALNAGWDADMLKVEIADLTAAEFDLSLLGFDDKMLASLTADATEGLTDPDEAPEAPATPVTVLGDVWVMGKHRIICGSSTEADTVSKLLGDVKPHLMVTDPPYGVEYDPLARKKNGSISNAVSGRVLNDDRADWREAWALFPGDVAYVWHADRMAHVVAESLISCRFNIRCQIVWVKTGHILGRGHYHQMHEPCFYAVKTESHWNGKRDQDTVWRIGKDRKHLDKQTNHGTQKPVECMKRPIENNSSPGQAVYEPFSGSGTTIIAGEMTGRHIYAVELNPAYVDVAVKRWQDFTGQQAVLESDGRTFADVAAQRVVQEKVA